MRETHDHERQHLLRIIQLQLLAMDLPVAFEAVDPSLLGAAGALLASYRRKTRLLRQHPAPADVRIEAFLRGHMADLDLAQPLSLPAETFVLSEHGLGRELSLPLGEDSYRSPLVSSYRVRNGVLHNPKSDRRTTRGTFHVARGGLPIPDDKVAVPKRVFAEMFRRAMSPPRELLILPFTARQPQPAEVFCSLYLRPLVVPEIPGVAQARSMELRFFAPGSLVSNLDFVESVFGNAGDPLLADNDAGLDVEGWTGHTGCVILAPHLIECTKRELGLPHWDDATERQRRDGVCWKEPDERYNGGQAFKITCRTDEGVIVTIIADNYFGYCKKEVKTQISYAANLYGNCEEEHAGGALVFPSYAVGEEFAQASRFSNGRTFAEVARDYERFIDVRPEGYGIDRAYPNIIYIPEDARLSVRTLKVRWQQGDETRTLPLLTDHYYVTPSGQKLLVDKHPGSSRFRLVVSVGEGTFCHKPCTVSGGGKSEISKSLHDYMIYGPVYVGDLERDLDQVQAVLERDHARRWRPGHAPHDYSKSPSRPILSERRSLGSVIKLLTPSPDYTDEYNEWLESIPGDVLSLVLLIKRLYHPDWGDRWRSRFTVDVINGAPGHELKVEDRKAAGSYLRVGFLPSQAWRTYRLRQDFYPALKVQTEDDITASTVVPAAWLRGLGAAADRASVKLVGNCERRLFQRPDEAIHPGLDRQAESDIARDDNFLSNFEPLAPADVERIVERITEFDRYTEPMQRLLREGAEQSSGWVVCSAYPRLVDGKPSKNPRYLQLRPDLVRPIEKHLAEMGVRLWRAVPADQPVIVPVDAVLFGRRNNPPEPDGSVRGLAVYNPIHYQELPELFMDFVCSLTGKSPSTTGAGSEGALTKGPFNAVLPTADLNSALVSFILTGLGGFSTAAGFVGPSGRVDHDLSLLIPELWCRMRPEHRDPQYLIANGYLEKLEDFDHEGGRVFASRLGYRITYAFVRTFFGRLFSNPSLVFDEDLLKPETQDRAAWIDGIRNITEAQQRVAESYLRDGSIEFACPPLRALLHIMARGQYEGRDVHHPEVRRLFTREYLLSSDWYAERLKTRQQREVALRRRQVAYLRAWSADPANSVDAARLRLGERLATAQGLLGQAEAPEYWRTLVGTTGADPLG